MYKSWTEITNRQGGREGGEKTCLTLRAKTEMQFQKVEGELTADL